MKTKPYVFLVMLMMMGVLSHAHEVGFRGTFHDWMLKGLLVYRFNY